MVTVNDTATGASSSASTNISVHRTLNQRYVAQMFLDTLNRPVDPGGLLYWSSQLDHGMSRSQLTNLLTHSDEYFGIIIQAAYQQYLGRGADAGGLAYWTAQMRAGLTDERLEAAFIGSPEFYQHSGGTDRAWVDAMYENLLGRLPDQGGENYWLQVLGQGASRSGVAYGFAASLEREGQLVQGDYRHYLHRSAGAAEVAFWVQQFSLGVTNEDVIAGFLSSPEYFHLSTST
jgi:hypothetical protein